MSKGTRALGRTIRRSRRLGYSKTDVLAYRTEFDQVWSRIRGLAAPAVRFIIELIQMEARANRDRRPLIHNGRKPR